MAGEGGDLKVLVIDDSAYNRRAVSDFLADIPGVSVVGKASDGQEGLQLAMMEEPDVITLDLEMPRMDGFTFLKILMSTRPTPVLVISAHSEQENVFRALELGAVDFVSKPTTRISPEIHQIRAEVVAKVMQMRNMHPSRRPNVAREAAGRALGKREAAGKRAARRDTDLFAAKRLVAVAASTGGPAAITRIVTSLSPGLEAAILVAQHMPAQFTTSFAARLDRLSQVVVEEAEGAALVRKGTVYVSPGDRCIEVFEASGALMVRAVTPDSRDRYVPSADRLFSSAAAAAGPDVLAVVLTGMGEDGSAGAVEVSEAGGRVVVESKESAVVSGMPDAAMRSGVVGEILDLDGIAALMESFAAGG